LVSSRFNRRAIFKLIRFLATLGEASRIEASAGIHTCSSSGAGKMALEGLPRSIRFAVWIDVQRDPRDFAPQ
jgi:hypothetical protein